MIIENGMKTLEIFGENRLDLLEKKQDHRDLMSDFDWEAKTKQGASKTLRVKHKSVA